LAIPAGYFFSAAAAAARPGPAAGSFFLAAATAFIKKALSLSRFLKSLGFTA
jgi:hypothetical protein